MTSLEERLKRIRQSAIDKSSSTSAPHRLNANNSSINNDEVEELLRQTSQLVAVEKQQGSDSYDPDDIEAWLAQESGEEEEEEEERNEGGERSSSGIGQDLREVEEASSRLTKDAEGAVRDLHSEGVLDEARSLLQVEPREKPILSRTPSNQSPKRNPVSLEDDLADAMAGELGSDNREELGAEERSSNKQVSDLTARLALLRSNTTSQGKAAPAPAQHVDLREGSGSNTLFDLPSAPSTKPVSIKEAKSNDTSDNWKERHQVEGRDLSSYEALVRLNATNLSAPTEKKKLKTTKQADARDETEDWCCICNEDAVLACSACDADIYCQKCWNEGHLDMDTEERLEHRTKLFAGRKRKPVVAAA